MNERRGFFERHGAAIQTVATVLGVVIAGLMLWSLGISRRQLESSIEPRLEISCGMPPIDLGGIIIPETNYVPGSAVPLTNVLASLDHSQLDRLKERLANLTKLKIRNAGAVSISDVQITLRLEAVLDERGEVTNAVYEGPLQGLSANLGPNMSVIHDFAEPALVRLAAERQVPAGTHVVCYVLTYRRSVDMKPKARLIVFQAWRLEPGSGPAAFVAAMPFGTYTSYYPKNGLSPRVIKEGVRKFLDQLDVMSPLDDQ